MGSGADINSTSCPLDNATAAAEGHGFIIRAFASQLNVAFSSLSTSRTMYFNSNLNFCRMEGWHRGHIVFCTRQFVHRLYCYTEAKWLN
ncbi:hypothetical protein KC19_1G095500 [Ceratodon purpureus]|uniref:Uncharacterized protein n=1 Tax=Ceratodon purpureus TaxID=3225 RepID=A0A8T0J4C1_CERPU|nr:hypothetical protein KC19_1G095500 [Ceratodon purpureus]